MRSYSIYILKCSDGYYYTGITNDVERRVSEHQQGLIPKCFTHTRRPVSLQYSECFENVWDAIAREKQIKGWTRAKKEALIKMHWDRLQELSKSHPSTGSG